MEIWQKDIMTKMGNRQNPVMFYRQEHVFPILRDKKAESRGAKDLQITTQFSRMLHMPQYFYEPQVDIVATVLMRRCEEEMITTIVLMRWRRKKSRYEHLKKWKRAYELFQTNDARNMEESLMPMKECCHHNCRNNNKDKIGKITFKMASNQYVMKHRVLSQCMAATMANNNALRRIVFQRPIHKM